MKYSEQHTVLAVETASHMGSGSLLVYATPAVVALMEHTACALIADIPTDAEGALPTTDDTTVGTRMVVDHLKACLVGEEVTSTATLISVSDRQYDFHIEVTDSCGNLLAQAEHTRFLVSASRFMAKLN